jgi:hypothetical protein
MQINFNANEYDPIQGTAVCFPLADYRVEITGAEPKVVKDNPAAGFLELTLTVIDGEMRGMNQKDRLNIFNPSEVAKRIAHQTLSAYCFAINRPYVQDTTQLIGGRLICTIGPQEDNPKYSEVKIVKCPDGSLPTRPQQQQQPATIPPSTATAPAWGATAPPMAPPSVAPPSAPSAPPWVNAQPGAPVSQPLAGPQTPPWAK